MALTKISTGGVKDDAASQAIIADEAVDEARLQVSNAGSNGQFLSKQSGNTGGLTWATPPDTNTQVGGATGVDFHDSTKIRIGAGNDLELHHDGNSYINNTTANQLAVQSDDLKLRSYTDLENYLVATHNGSVDIYHNGVKKLETTSSGINVTGQINVNGSALSAAPEVTGTTDGAVTAGDPIIATSEGKLAKVAAMTKTAGTAAEANGTYAGNIQVAYDKISGKVAAAFRESGKISIKVGTVSGTTVTWLSLIHISEPTRPY